VLDSSNLTGNSTGNSTALDKTFNALKANPLLTYPELASLLGYSRSYVQKCIKMLKETKRIRRVGSKTYGGYWEIIENLKS
jgi:predicted HTH transcriptional regulator